MCPEFLTHEELPVNEFDYLLGIGSGGDMLNPLYLTISTLMEYQIYESWADHTLYGSLL